MNGRCDVSEYIFFDVINSSLVKKIYQVKSLVGNGIP